MVHLLPSGVPAAVGGPSRTQKAPPRASGAGCQHCQAADLDPKHPGNCPTFVMNTASGGTETVAVWVYVQQYFNLDFGQGGLWSSLRLNSIFCLELNCVSYIFHIFQFLGQKEHNIWHILDISGKCHTTFQFSRIFSVAYSPMQNLTS